MNIFVADSVREKIESLEQTVTTTRNAVAEVILMIKMIRPGLNSLNTLNKRAPDEVTIIVTKACAINIKEKK